MTTQTDDAPSIDTHCEETTTPAEETIDTEYPCFPPSALAQLRPHIRSRWAACIAKFDEDVPYRDFDRVFGIAEPCIVRTPRSVGPAYAASCIGVRISCYTRDDGLRTGRVGFVDTDGSSQLLAPIVGFIEDAVATPHGIVAVLAIMSDVMHKDLLALDGLGQLGVARLCMLQRTSSVRDVTPWGLSVWTVQSTRARLCQFTSLSHVAGQHVIRQMALDESLTAEDLLPTERRWMPAVCGGNEALGSAVVADINPGAVKTQTIEPNAVSVTPSRALGSSSFSTTSTSFTDVSGVTSSYTSVAGGTLIVMLRMPLGARNTAGGSASIGAYGKISEVVAGSEVDYAISGVGGEGVPASGSTAATLTIPLIVQSTAAGTVYTFKAMIRAGGSNITAFLDASAEWEISIVELKR